MTWTHDGRADDWKDAVDEAMLGPQRGLGTLPDPVRWR